MLKEIINFVDKWEASVTGSLNTYPDINLIVVPVRNDFSIEAKHAQWLEGAGPISKYFDKVENEKYKSIIFALKKIVAPISGNKALGSTLGLMTASPYGFKLFDKFFETYKSNTKQTYDTKIIKNYSDTNKLFEVIDKELLSSLKQFLIEFFDFSEFEETLSEKKVQIKEYILLLLKLKFSDLPDFKVSAGFKEEIKKYLKWHEGNSKKKQGFDYLKKETYFLFLLPDAYLSGYHSFRETYIKNKCFLKSSLSKRNKINDLICPVCHKMTSELGVPNSYSNANESKPFLFHIDTKFHVNVRVCLECAQKIFSFSEILKEYGLSFFPLFISTEQNVINKLNEKTFRIMNASHKRKSFAEILRGLKEESNGISVFRNFYLFTRQGKENLFIDYVDYFDIGKNIEIVIKFRKNDQQREINDIFDFFYKIDEYFFNKKLGTNFFTEQPKDEDYKIVILKYRGILFDIIYRSKFYLFRKEMMDELIRFCLRRHISMDIQNKKTLKNKEMLEIITMYEALLKFFNHKGGVVGIDIKNIEAVISSEDRNISLKGDEAAYLSGHIVYYLLSRSKTASKSHALAERFFSIRSIDRLKHEIIELAKKYNHDLSFGYKKFNKALSLVLQTETEKSFTEIEIPFFAGYFDDNLFYEKKGN